MTEIKHQDTPPRVQFTATADEHLKEWIDMVITGWHRTGRVPAATDRLTLPKEWAEFERTMYERLRSSHRIPAAGMLTFTPPSTPAKPGPAHFGATPVEPIVPKEHSKVVADLLGLPPPGTLSERALKFINKKRAGFQRPLDPKASKWTDDDVVLEAKRLGWQP